MMDIISTTMNIEVETNDSSEEDWYVQHLKLVKTKNYQEQAFKLVCEKINIIFPNYLEDSSFGGEKKFIKINLIDNEYHVCYINPELKSLTYSENGDVKICKDYYDLTEQELMHINFNIICEDRINFAFNEELNYFHMLVEKQFIIPNEIYDLQSNSFTRKISKTKMNIPIQNYNDFINTHNMVDENSIYNRIHKLLCYNFAINDKIYASINTEEYEKKVKIKNFGQLYVNIGMMRDPNMITLHKINKKYYDYKSFFRKYTPYRIQRDDNNNYYIINRDYKYIGLNGEPIKFKCIGEYYLFNDGSKPWENRADYIQFCNKYNKIVRDHSLKDCLNMHNSTITILTLLD